MTAIFQGCFSFSSADFTGNDPEYFLEMVSFFDNIFVAAVVKFPVAAYWMSTALNRSFVLFSISSLFYVGVESLIYSSLISVVVVGLLSR